MIRFSKISSQSFLILLLTIISSIDAKSKPKLDQFADRRSTKNGSSTKFLCSVQEGTKPFRFEWRKNNLLLSIVELPINYRIETNQDESTLMITKLSPNDSGNYSCTVRNNFGFDTQQIVLIVKGLLCFRSISLISIQFNRWRINCRLDCQK